MLLAVAMVIFPVLIGIYDLGKAWRAANRDLDHALNAQTTALQRWFGIHKNNIRSIASLPSVQARDYERMYADFQSFARTNANFDSIVYVDTGGRPRVRSESGVDTHLYLNLSDRDYFKKAEEGTPYITDVIIGRTSGIPIIIFSIPLMGDDGFQGLVFSSIRFDTLLKTILSTNFGTTGRFLLLDSKGMAVQAAGDREFPQKAFDALRSSNGHSVSFSFSDQTGKKYLARGKMLDKTQFFLVATIEYAEFLGPFVANMLYFVTAAGVLLLAALFITRKLNTRVDRSLSHLFEGVAKAEQGQYDSLDPSLLEEAPYELRELGIAFSSMAETIRRKTSELEFRSFHDELTGLYNRAFFEDAMARFDSGRFDPVTVVVCDVNGLKLINDTLGHKAGDKLLKAAADVLEKAARKSDIIARIGGDEYALLMPKTSGDMGARIVERIDLEIAKYKEHDDSLPLNIACGAATTSGKDRNPESIFQEADKKMYASKQAERTRSRREIMEYLSSRLDRVRKGSRDRHTAACSAIMEVFVKAQPDLSSIQSDFLVRLAQNHDIGFVEVPPEIIRKPGKLTEEEYSMIKRHPETGARIASIFPELADLAESIRLHHRWWNGKGYPEGEGGETIPLESRIMAIVDAYEAMTGDKTYRTPLEPNEAAAELLRCAGTQFDPAWTERFVSFFFATD